jgi:DUF1365 family protein
MSDNTFETVSYQAFFLIFVPICWYLSWLARRCRDYSICGKRHKTWFRVVAVDYLERGNHKDGLAGKLRDYHLSQSLAPERFLYAYLVTAPRLLGFSFNPVSFWYLHDSNRSLAAMILEVKNTFYERRMYIMERNQIRMGPRIRASNSHRSGLKISMCLRSMIVVGLTPCYRRTSFMFQLKACTE